MKKIRISNIIPQIALLLLGLLFIAPFVFMLSTSFKLPSEIFEMPPRLIPRVFTLENYAQAFMTIPFFRYTLNTFLITFANVAGQLIIAPMIAYSLSLIDWSGKKIIFPLVLVGMMIPQQVTMIPLYMTFFRLGLTGSFWPLIIPAFLGIPSLYIFLLRQFFMGFPKSLIHAAKVDGASEIRIFYGIVLPLCKPALVAVSIFTFLYTWTDFLNPLLYLSRSEMYTLSIGLQAFVRERYVEWGPLMAASFLFTLPVIILFFAAQRQFVEGITLSGVKS
ncbi:MAG: carbohydrate ABC transporter permease [Oscillospiraceae bacterium]|nr:carbohydrate ABC transporter permease [Oscillospiraceae bacterium]